MGRGLERRLVGQLPVLFLEGSLKFKRNKSLEFTKFDCLNGCEPEILKQL